MRLILFLFCLYSVESFASFMNMHDFKSLSLQQQVEVLKSYKAFIALQNDNELSDTVKIHSLSFISEAYAAQSADCFYAGWPSVKKKVGNKSVCSSPANSEAYKSQATKCSSSELLCNPLLFGKDICVSVATRSLRNRAFAQCESKSDVDLASIAQEITSGARASEAEEMFQLVKDVCDKGFQASTGMCTNLENRISAIKAVNPTVAATGPEEEDIVVVAPKKEERLPTLLKSEKLIKPKDVTPVVVSKPPTIVQEGKIVTSPKEKTVLIEAAKQADKINDAIHVHNPGCADEHGPQISESPRVLPSAPDSLNRVTCEKPQLSAADRKPEELNRLLKEYNISVTTSISNQQYIWDFVAQVQRFPQDLLKEMVDAGANIHVFEGSGVTADPSWKKSPEAKTKDARFWTDVPGSGGNIKSRRYRAAPTRIAINHLYDNHGTSNLFLHEHGHTVDRFYGAERPLHESSEFKNLRAQDPKWTEFMKKLCPGKAKPTDPDYCTDNEEGFAELFAYYHACDASRAHLIKHMPATAAYFEKLKLTKNGKSRAPASVVEVESAPAATQTEESKPKKSLFGFGFWGL